MLCLAWLYKVNLKNPRYCHGGVISAWASLNWVKHWKKLYLAFLLCCDSICRARAPGTAPLWISMDTHKGSRAEAGNGNRSLCFLQRCTFPCKDAPVVSWHLRRPQFKQIPLLFCCRCASFVLETLKVSFCGKGGKVQERFTAMRGEMVSVLTSAY